MQTPRKFDFQNKEDFQLFLHVFSSSSVVVDPGAGDANVRLPPTDVCSSWQLSCAASASSGSKRIAQLEQENAQLKKAQKTQPNQDKGKNKGKHKHGNGPAAGPGVHGKVTRTKAGGLICFALQHGGLRDPAGGREVTSWRPRLR